MTRLRWINSANSLAGVRRGEQASADALLSFRQETLETPRSISDPWPQEQAQPAPLQVDRDWRIAKWMWAVIAIAVVEAVVIGIGAYERHAPTASAMATVHVTSTPLGASVLIDGTSRGATPLSLSLRPGEHQIGIRTAAATRNLSVTVRAGADSSQYFDLTSGAGEAPAPERDTGSLEISSDPSGAAVTLDGTSRGATPLRLANLAPGAHRVVVTANGQSINRTVFLQKGTAATLYVPMAQANGLLSGWVRIRVPMTLQIFENGELLGTTETDRIMLAAGRHNLELTNKALGFTSRQTVQVAAGTTNALDLSLPSGVLSVNALPWAEVWVDGQRLGETPIANLSLPIGDHKVVFRHPQLGEQERTVSVTLLGPTRVGVDLTK